MRFWGKRLFARLLSLRAGGRPPKEAVGRRRNRGVSRGKTGSAATSPDRSPPANARPARHGARGVPGRLFRLVMLSAVRALLPRFVTRPLWGQNSSVQLTDAIQGKQWFKCQHLPPRSHIKLVPIRLSGLSKRAKSHLLRDFSRVVNWRHVGRTRVRPGHQTNARQLRAISRSGMSDDWRSLRIDLERSDRRREQESHVVWRTRRTQLSWPFNDCRSVQCKPSI